MLVIGFELYEVYTGTGGEWLGCVNRLVDNEWFVGSKGNDSKPFKTLGEAEAWVMQE